jgi:heme-degrading monooxygenase HmoA
LAAAGNNSWLVSSVDYHCRLNAHSDLEAPPWIRIFKWENQWLLESPLNNLEEGRMICRIWHGWTSPRNADAYEKVVRSDVIPGIEARRIPGFRQIDLLRHDAGDEVEFTTLMWFDSLEAVKEFMGEDYSVSHVPAAARAVLSRFDERALHCQVIDRRPQH